MQLKTLTLMAASLALAQARVNGTWGDHSKAPVLDTTATTTATTTTHPTLPTKPTGKPVDGGKTDVADETVSDSSTWVDADVPSSSKPVADATTSSTNASYWGDASLPVAGETTTTTTSATWGDETDVADSTTSSTTIASYWGDETDVADETTTSTTSAHWSDITKIPELATTEETTVEEITKTITKGDGSEITTTEVNTITITHTVYVKPTPVLGGEGQPPKETPVLGGGCGVVTVTNTVVQTITVPAGGHPAIPKPPPATTTTTTTTTTAPVIDTSVELSSWQDVPTAFAAAAAPAPAPTSGGYYGVIQTWRSNLGLKALELDSKLQSNAQDTSNESGGALKHKLNPGSMAQVMAPGDADNFESVFVGGWLCELPSHPGLGASVCNAASKGWNYAGQTGHAEILTSSKYSKIGCGLGDGIWTCDLA